MAVLLGLAAALAYGIGDFLGGLISRRIHFGLVSVIGASTAFVATGLVVLLSPTPAPVPSALLLGAASGIGSGLGTLALYRGLGRGQMGIVAPLSAIGTAAVPVVIGVVLGDRPSTIAWAGVALAFPAIWLVSTSGATERDTRFAAGVIDGLLAGVGFALLLVGLDQAGESSGLWPVVASQAAASVVVGAFMLAALRSIDRRDLPRRHLVGAAIVGITGASASVFYFWSTHEGLLSIVAVLTSLYPAVTVLLAAGVLREPISRRQAIGLALAAIAVVLIVLA
ncbi:MAG TPA: DMT family transporter [Candidatus Limnocylindrales bacterium]|jgi:drug/metabolite transporter (DMT)-like permease